MHANLVETDLTGCRIYGISAWGLEKMVSKKKHWSLKKIFKTKLSGSFRPSFGAQVFSALAMCFFLLFLTLSASLGDASIAEFGDWAASAAFVTLSYWAFIIFRGVGLVNKDADTRIGDEERTVFATEVLAKARSGEKVKFSLYLRPFSSTGILMFDPLHSSAMPFVEDPEFHDVERIVAECVEKLAPLVALGAPGEHMGAGRILTSDSEWKEALRVLAEAAQFTIMLPAENAGTLWEIGFLKREGLFHKTLFLMPPKAKGEFDMVGFWSRATEAIAAHHGLNLPAYDPLGGLFTIDDDGNFHRIGSLKDMRSFSKHFHRAARLLRRHKSNNDDDFITLKIPRKKTRSLPYRWNSMFAIVVSLAVGTCSLVWINEYRFGEAQWASSQVSTGEGSVHVSHPGDWEVNRITDHTISMRGARDIRECRATYSPVESFPFLYISKKFFTMSDILSNPQDFEREAAVTNITVGLVARGDLDSMTGRITDAMPDFGIMSALRSRNSEGGRSGYVVELDVNGTARKGGSINEKQVSALTASSTMVLYVKCIDRNADADSVGVFLRIAESSKMN